MQMMANIFGITHIFVNKVRCQLFFNFTEAQGCKQLHPPSTAALEFRL